jgi:hypothetical protein
MLSVLIEGVGHKWAAWRMSQWNATFYGTNKERIHKHVVCHRRSKRWKRFLFVIVAAVNRIFILMTVYFTVIQGIICKLAQQCGLHYILVNHINIYVDTVVQWFSTFVRPRPGKFLFSIRREPGILDVRARCLRNTGIVEQNQKITWQKWVLTTCDDRSYLKACFIVF